LTATAKASYDGLNDMTVPLLLVVDYAETRPVEDQAHEPGVAELEDRQEDGE
jgi:hypothetical protein